MGGRGVCRHSVDFLERLPVGHYRAKVNKHLRVRCHAHRHRRKPGRRKGNHPGAAPGGARTPFAPSEHTGVPLQVLWLAAGRWPEPWRLADVQIDLADRFQLLRCEAGLYVAAVM